ncbi:MAG: hypothetical protein MRK02_04590 [Candidatus Scalindua sp.]|nr:hypothetical protein [Candidatus Scalindua sp.]
MNKQDKLSDDTLFLQVKSFFIRKAEEKYISENEIMVDITGGQKPTSIVGISVTFNRKIKAQYVQTGDPYDVLSYDVILHNPDHGAE